MYLICLTSFAIDYNSVYFSSAMGELLLKTDRNLPQSEPDIDPCDLLASKACSDWPQAKRSLSAVKSRRSLSTVKEKRKQKKAQIVYRTGTSRYMSCHATRHKQCTGWARHATCHVTPQGTNSVHERHVTLQVMSCHKAQRGYNILQLL